MFLVLEAMRPSTAVRGGAALAWMSAASLADLEKQGLSGLGAEKIEAGRLALLAAACRPRRRRRQCSRQVHARELFYTRVAHDLPFPTVLPPASRLRLQDDFIPGV